MIRNYIFKKVEKDPDLFSDIWNSVEKVTLDNDNFCGKEAPSVTVTAQGVCSVRGITVRFESDEKAPVVNYTHSNQPAWLDSCVEFFFAPCVDGEKNYLNFEQSVGGALLIQKGPSGADRKYIPHSDEEFRTEKEIREDGWTVKFFVPYSFIYKHFERMDNSFCGNFQFCCEDKDIYLTWNRIENPTPAFHKPEYFGNMTLDLSDLDVLHRECLLYGYNVYDICEMTESGISKKTVTPSVYIHEVYSITKCILSMLVGIMHDKGMIDINERISKYLGEYFPENVDPKWYDVTVADILHHRTGGSGGAQFNKHVYEACAEDKDYLAYIFCDALPYEIGKEIVYCESNYYIISRLIEKLSGKKPDEFARLNLFNPLGMGIVSWPMCPQGHCMGGSGVCMSAEDMVKLGWVYANKGVYQGKRILSEEWIALATEIIPVDNYGGYGFAVQKCSYMQENEYYLAGAGDQCVIFTVGKPKVIAFQAAGAGAHLGLTRKAVELLRE